MTGSAKVQVIDDVKDKSLGEIVAEIMKKNEEGMKKLAAEEHAKEMRDKTHKNGENNK